MNLYHILYIIHDKNNPRFCQEIQHSWHSCTWSHQKYQVECPPGATRWVISASASAKNKEKQWFKCIILQCFQYFVFWKGKWIVSFAIPHVTCWYHSSWWVAYNFQDSTGWSLWTTHFLGMIDFPYMFFSMKTMFPGWFSMWIQGNSNTFVSSPCLNSYDFPYMIYELCQPADAETSKKCFTLMRSRKFNTTPTKTNMSPKKGSFRKQSSLPTTLFSRTCMFSGK